MTDKEIIKRLYKEYVNRYLNKIFFALFLSLIIAGSTAAVAWLLDPAIKKIFVEKNNAKKNFLRYLLTYSLYNLFIISLLVSTAIFFIKI